MSILLIYGKKSQIIGCLISGGFIIPHYIKIKEIDSGGATEGLRRGLVSKVGKNCQRKLA